MEFYIVFGSILLGLGIFYAFINRKFIKIFFGFFFHIDIAEFKEYYFYGKKINGSLNFKSKRKGCFPLTINLELRRQVLSHSHAYNAYSYSKILYRVSHLENIDLDAGSRKDIDFALKIPKLEDLPENIQKILQNKFKKYNGLISGEQYSWVISTRIHIFGFSLRYYDWNIDLFQNAQQKKELFKKVNSSLNTDVSFSRYVKLTIIAIICFVTLMAFGFYLMK